MKKVKIVEKGFMAGTRVRLRHGFWIVIQDGIRRLFGPSPDSWTQARFIGGLILSAGVISLLLTTDLRPAVGRAVNSPTGHDSAVHLEGGDCGARSADGLLGKIANVR
ncbi:MAG: hypothetical protein AB7R40_22635 [Nitrospiraceae bacterium]